MPTVVAVFLEPRITIAGSYLFLLLPLALLILIMLVLGLFRPIQRPKAQLPGLLSRTRRAGCFLAVFVAVL